MSLKKKLAKREMSKLLSRGAVIITECDTEDRYEAVYEVGEGRRIGLTIFHALSEHIPTTKNNYKVLRAVNSVLDDSKSPAYTYLLNVTKKFFKTIV